MRLYFYVSDDDTRGHWRIATRDGDPWTAPIEFPTREHATEAAAKLALAEWTATHRPTGVRVRLGPGNWTDSHNFGEAPPSIFTPQS